MEALEAIDAVDSVVHAVQRNYRQRHVRVQRPVMDAALHRLRQSKRNPGLRTSGLRRHPTCSMLLMPRSYPPARYQFWAEHESTPVGSMTSWISFASRSSRTSWRTARTPKLSNGARRAIAMRARRIVLRRGPDAGRIRGSAVLLLFGRVGGVSVSRLSPSLGVVTVR